MVLLNGVQETMLIPLAIKASETKRPNARIQDAKAVEIVEQLDLDREMRKYSFRGKLFAAIPVI